MDDHKVKIIDAFAQAEVVYLGQPTASPLRGAAYRAKDLAERATLAVYLDQLDLAAELADAACATEQPYGGTLWSTFNRTIKEARGEARRSHHRAPAILG